MGVRIDEPDYPLGVKGKDFLVKVYLEMIAYLTIPKNIFALMRNAKEALKPGEHYDKLIEAANARFNELRAKKKEGNKDA